MQPKTAVTFDKLTFQNMKRTLVPLAETGRKRREDPTYAAPVPYEIGIKLNNGCNLRCKHCFEWNPDGFHHGFASEVKRDEIGFPSWRNCSPKRENANHVCSYGGRTAILLQVR